MYNYLYSMSKYKLPISYEYLRMRPIWDFLDDVYFGNFKIAFKASKYLNKYPGESEEQYTRRCKASVFYNFLRPSVRSISNKPFAHEVTYKPKFDERLEFLKKDFTLKGKSLLETAKDSFELALRHGGVAFLADNDTSNGSNRPFCRVIPFRDILGCWRGNSGEIQRVIFQVRKIWTLDQQSMMEYKGRVTGAGDGEFLFNERAISEIYELVAPNMIRKYKLELKEDDVFLNSVASRTDRPTATTSDLTNKSSISVELISERKIEGFEKLPFYLFLAEQPCEHFNVLEVPPPFYDLAKMNISHFNKQSDQDTIMTVSRFAIFCASGLSDQDVDKAFKNKTGQKAIGPFSVLVSQEKDAKFYYAEHSGNAIRAGFEDIMRIEKKMTNTLNEYLLKEVPETATEFAIDEKNRMLYVLSLSYELEKIFSSVIKDCAKFSGFDIDLEKEDGKLLAFSKEFSIIEMREKLNGLLFARKYGELTTETFLNELDNLGIFSSEFSLDEELRKSAQEVMERMKAESQVQNQAKPANDDNEGSKENKRLFNNGQQKG